MMSYQNGYVVSVLIDGKPIKESREKDRRICRIPFGSEYKIRLKNNHPVRAMVTISIDGVDVVMHGDKLILFPYQTLDVERFVENLSEGKKFRFVSVNSHEVSDPTSSENGLIEVNFWKEVPDLASHTLYTCGIPINAVGSTTDAGATYTISSSAVSSCDLGATVDGAHSSQAFIAAQRFPIELDCTTLKLWLKGPSDTRSFEEFVIKLSGNGAKPYVSFGGKEIEIYAVTLKDGKALIRGPGLEIETSRYKLLPP